MLKLSSLSNKFGVSHVLALAVSVASISSVSAQVETRDSTGESVSQAFYNSPQPRVAEQPQQANAGDLFFEVQQLREEMMQLRGLVEEQAYEIKRLKQQRLDDYMDLDRRVAALTLGSGGAIQVAQSNQSANQVTTDVEEAPVNKPVDVDPAQVDPNAERDEYRAAFGLLTSRKMPEALVAFEAFLAKYPQGKYAANAYYWMGEIYGFQGDSDKAEAQFLMLIQAFPDDRKTIDGRFKLGKLLFEQGDYTGAREQLDIVAASNTETANLAKAFIRDNL